jgi:hypothetical protein
MAANQVQLQCPDLCRGYALIREGTESCVDAIGGFVGFDDAGHGPDASVHSIPGLLRQAHPRSFRLEGKYIFQPQVPAGEDQIVHNGSPLT